MRWSEALAAGATYLARQQRPDGGFTALAGSRQDLADGRDHSTIFGTAVVLGCLPDRRDTAALRRRAADFLRYHQNANGSWNYWMRDAGARQHQPYPDDLDDTACALAALWRYDDRLATGPALAGLARLLITAETAPGGPYRTWLVTADAPAVWRDVDVAVNANIGHLLHARGVRLPGLEAFLTEAINAGELVSPYYVGPAPALYFASRWYDGPARQRLAELVRQRLSVADDPLELALLLSAGLRLGVSPGVWRPAAQRLAAAQHDDGSWPARALYIGPPAGGAMQYAGSKELTTALAMEALSLAATGPPAAGEEAAVAQPRLAAGPALRLLVRQTAELPVDLRSGLQSELRRIAAADRDGQVTAMADQVAAAGGWKLPARLLARLNAGSLAGWTAYTLLDDFWDGDGQPERLGVATAALRLCLRNFELAVPHPAFRQLVYQALDCMDAGNTWEATHARAAAASDCLRLPQLPDYGDLSQLAERSWGHMLAASGVWLAAGVAPDDREFQQLQRYFHHFLIARQLHDDAHDWEEDLLAGRLTAVAVMVLRPDGTHPRELEVAAALPDLRRRFWRQTISQVAVLIQAHIAESRQALADCGRLTDDSALHVWLDRLEAGARRAISDRDQVSQFLEVFGSGEHQSL